MTDVCFKSNFDNSLFLDTRYLRLHEYLRSELSSINGYLPCKTLGCCILAHVLLSIRLLSAVEGTVCLHDYFPYLLHGIDFLGIY